MEVRRTVIVEVHRDHDSEEATDRWHASHTRAHPGQQSPSGTDRSVSRVERRLKWAGLDSNQGPTDYELARSTSSWVDLALVSGAVSS